MRFTVTFQGKKGYAVEIPKSEIGLFEVNTAREKLGAKLPLERIAGHVKMALWDIAIELTEEQARKTGLFHNRKSVVVTGQPGFLNRHTRKHVACNRNKETGEFLGAWVTLAICEDAVLEEWTSLGHPIEWPRS